MVKANRFILGLPSCEQQYSWASLGIFSSTPLLILVLGESVSDGSRWNYPNSVENWCSVLARLISKGYFQQCWHCGWDTVVPEKPVHFKASTQITESSAGWRGIERSWKEASLIRESAVHQEIKADGQYSQGPSNHGRRGRGAATSGVSKRNARSHQRKKMRVQ